MKTLVPSLVLAALLATPASPAGLSVRSLPSPARAGSGEPSLARGPEGRVWLSWFEKRREGGHALKLAPLAGRRWGAARTIAAGDSFFVNWADFPAVLPLTERRLVAAWPWKRPGGTYAYDVRVAWSEDAGATWSAPIVPHRDDTPTEHGFVSLAPEGDGARIVWLDGRNFVPPAGADSAAAAGHEEGKADMTLRSARLLPGGGLEDQVELDGRTCDCCQTAAVATASGMLVAYRDRAPDERRDISAVRLRAGEWTAPEELSRDGWIIEGCPVNGPALDAGGDGVVVAWFSAAADSPRVMVAFSDDGGATCSRGTRVDLGQPLGRVDVVRLDDGAAAVVWLEGGEQDARVLMRRVARDAGPGPITPIARTSKARAAGFPRVVRDGTRLVFAWTDPSGGGRVRVAETALPR